jgi:hypothetical protein
MHKCMCTYMFGGMYERTYTYVYTHMCTHGGVSMDLCTCVCMCVCVCLCVCVCVCVCVCLYTCKHVRMTCVFRYEWRYLKMCRISFVTQTYFSSSRCDAINETTDIRQGGNEKYSTSTQGFVLCTYTAILSTSCQQRIHPFSILNSSIYWMFTLL